MALGYDPGGDDHHGVAALNLRDGGARVLGAEVATVKTTEQAVAWLGERLPKGGDANIATTV